MPSTNYIVIQLPNPAYGYLYVEMFSERKHWPESVDGPYVVVNLNIEKVIEYVVQSGQKMPGPPSSWQEGKEKYFAWAWSPDSGTQAGTLAHLPRLSAYKRPTDALVRFGNGRHRTEFLRSQGVTVMPFECREQHAELLIGLCG